MLTSNNAANPTAAKKGAKARSVGHYILGKTIGEGTFGKVKLGTHILTGGKVAIKILEKERIVDVADVERVAREIHILKMIRHPHIIQLYEIIETPRQLYLIMEYAPGGELFDYIVQCQRVPEVEACKFFHQIIAGVEKIHQQRVVHRDLKPENLLLDDHKNIKIVDFGLSNTYEPDQLLKTACGSPCYAAPEMIAGKKYVPSCCDIWSCGVILFALVCGYLPFEDANTSQLYKKILAGDYEAPKFISHSVRSLISGMLNTDPTKRFRIVEVRNHAWFNQPEVMAAERPLRRRADDFASCDVYSCDHCITWKEKLASENEPDTFVVEQLEKYGFPRDYVVRCLKLNKHNHITTTYYLLLEKRLRLMPRVGAHPQRTSLAQASRAEGSRTHRVGGPPSVVSSSGTTRGGRETTRVEEERAKELAKELERKKEAQKKQQAASNGDSAGGVRPHAEVPPLALQLAQQQQQQGQPGQPQQAHTPRQGDQTNPAAAFSLSFSSTLDSARAVAHPASRGQTGGSATPRVEYPLPSGYPHPVPLPHPTGQPPNGHHLLFAPHPPHGQYPVPLPHPPRPATTLGHSPLSTGSQRVAAAETGGATPGKQPSSSTPTPQPAHHTQHATPPASARGYPPSSQPRFAYSPSPAFYPPSLGAPPRGSQTARNHQHPGEENGTAQSQSPAPLQTNGANPLPAAFPMRHSIDHAGGSHHAGIGMPPFTNAIHAHALYPHLTQHQNNQQQPQGAASGQEQQQPAGPGKSSAPGDALCSLDLSAAIAAGISNLNVTGGGMSLPPTARGPRRPGDLSPRSTIAGAPASGTSNAHAPRSPAASSNDPQVASHSVAARGPATARPVARGASPPVRGAASATQKGGQGKGRAGTPQEKEAVDRNARTPPNAADERVKETRTPVPETAASKQPTPQPTSAHVGAAGSTGAGRPVSRGSEVSARSARERERARPATAAGMTGDGSATHRRRHGAGSPYAVQTPGSSAAGVPRGSATNRDNREARKVSGSTTSRPLSSASPICDRVQSVVERLYGRPQTSQGTHGRSYTRYSNSQAQGAQTQRTPRPASRNGSGVKASGDVAEGAQQTRRVATPPNAASGAANGPPTHVRRRVYTQTACLDGAVQGGSRSRDAMDVSGSSSVGGQYGNPLSSLRMRGAAESRGETAADGRPIPSPLALSFNTQNPQDPKGATTNPHYMPGRSVLSRGSAGGGNDGGLGESNAVSGASGSATARNAAPGGKVSRPIPVTSRLVGALTHREGAESRQSSAAGGAAVRTGGAARVSVDRDRESLLAWMEEGALTHRARVATRNLVTNAAGKHRGAFNAVATTEKKGPLVMGEMQRALVHNRVAFRQTGSLKLVCQRGPLKFEMVCAALDQHQTNVVKFKRLEGDHEKYKDICSKVLGVMRI
uniref:non-specific serine/threonine protein kinase n=1 Tax=Chromera velia CCMP2878 TaxID=1169474 RepID=A0A0G4FJM3_9ALVE|eukprot:Cvel_17209.t1-p1 / transcript=Cvel_17209.t1 / gene=Cvel_17209 / organism=Chromera_velia_CCMP2878 / gene_product=SNF1-related protein kinase catalytic subunit alpha, putative / transcript_product=SNF1-related protein kinase catalytic subunit alpha, putative / location=Cvel_scaffold1361:18231-27027(-) / protein_length=1403 / sequence_SO=supercontig / SO=protein_coding / is_pseudo=false